MDGLYMGHTADYWLELEKRAQKEMLPEARELLQEVATLKGKLAFCASRTKQITDVLGSDI